MTLMLCLILSGALSYAHNAVATRNEKECLSVPTPNGLQVYIPNDGNYIVTFTLSNGDVYAGEFTVTD